MARQMLPLGDHALVMAGGKGRVFAALGDVGEGRLAEGAPTPPLSRRGGRRAAGQALPLPGVGEPPPGPIKDTLLYSSAESTAASTPSPSSLRLR